MTPQEPDFPPGHPARCDYDPSSPAAKEWARQNSHPLGERDFPVDHPKALDTPGNKNAVVWSLGVDPDRPGLVPFRGLPAPSAATEAATGGATVSPALAKLAFTDPAAMMAEAIANLKSA